MAGEGLENGPPADRALLCHAGAYFFVLSHADLYPGARYADRAHDQAHWSLLIREHVLDAAVRIFDFCALAIRMRSGIGRPGRFLR